MDIGVWMQVCSVDKIIAKKTHGVVPYEVVEWYSSFKFMTNTLEWIFAFEKCSRTASQCLPILEFWFKAATRNQGKRFMNDGVSSDAIVSCKENINVAHKEKAKSE